MIGSASGTHQRVVSAYACVQVWADQGFWQSAIAARPSAAYKGYILGGLLWCAHLRFATLGAPLMQAAPQYRLQPPPLYMSVAACCFPEAV